jgi:DNA-binding HxlR family transcriptional regulator
VVAVKKASFADMHCSVAQSLEVIGEWWTLLILRDAFLGVTRFDDFAKRLGIARNVLTARLDTLVENDVLTRVPYDEARGRYDYRLTDKGRALLPVLTAIRQWGDEWILGEDQAPIVVEHTTCGHLSRGVLTCDHCHEELTTRTLRARRGPGFRDDVALLPAEA